jgi:rhodanese-related sulfurtransferase
MSPQQFLTRRAEPTPLVLVDVREEWELGIASVPVSLLHIPLGQLSARLNELDPATETVVMCRSGGRSLQAANFLASKGFAKVHNLTGGILAWSRDVDPTIPAY